MKLHIESISGKKIKEYFFVFEEIMQEAQANTGAEPLHAVASLLSERLKSEGIVLNDKTLIELERSLGDIAAGISDGKTGIVLKIKNTINEDKNKMKERGMGKSEVFDSVISYPDSNYKDIYDSLVGLDDIKERLVKESIFLTSPEVAEKWSRRWHKGVIAAIKTLERRSPFLIFAGDVGTGKTVLAESFGNAVAEEMKKPVKLLKLSILTRGSGLVGEMTKLISGAFKAVEAEANSFGGPVILLLDEADTLAQSREATQMHHEDKAGVNALIQGIDRIRFSAKHILVVFCTNRLGAIDPAVRRRAADIFEFSRPNEEQRQQIFNIYGKDIKLKKKEIARLVKLTGSVNGREYGFTYSDLIDKVIPNAIFASFPNKPLSFNALEQAVLKTIPTRPFGEK